MRHRPDRLAGNGKVQRRRAGGGVRDKPLNGRAILLVTHGSDLIKRTAISVRGHATRPGAADWPAPSWLTADGTDTYDEWMILPSFDPDSPASRDGGSDAEPTLAELEAALAASLKQLEQLDADMDAAVYGFMIPWVRELRHAAQLSATKVGQFDWNGWNSDLPEKYAPAFEAVRILDDGTIDVEDFVRNEGPLASKLLGHERRLEFVRAVNMAASFCFLAIGEERGRPTISVSGQGRRALAAFDRLNASRRRQGQSEDPSKLHWLEWLLIASLGLAAGIAAYFYMN